VYEIDLAEDLQGGTIFLEIRHGAGIPYETVPIRASYQGAEGEKKIDFDFRFRSAEGRLVGEGMGDTFDTRQVFWENATLSKGKHKIMIQTTTEAEFLAPISEIGIVIEKKKP
jgi:gliding motility-associated lipoprotein GldH